MKVGMLGLGKLGLPLACAFVLAGHEVYGNDICGLKTAKYASGVSGLYEPDMDAVLSKCLLNGLHLVDSVQEAVKPAEIVFIVVPTPSLYNGAFDTQPVKDALAEVASVIAKADEYKVVAVCSTVLPGTCRQEFIPVLSSIVGEDPGLRYGFAHNAQFNAMGSVIENMREPEFVLLGEFDHRSGDVLARFYRDVAPGAPIQRMSIESAETTKMFYNVHIGFKIVAANALMELADKVGADCDVVSETLALATNRIVSDRYMRGGMGDGGGCHPRDSCALSYLAKTLRMQANPFQFIAEARIAQSRFLAQEVAQRY